MNDGKDQKQKDREYNKEYRLKNKEKIKKDAAEWYQKNKERVNNKRKGNTIKGLSSKEYQRQYRLKNKKGVAKKLIQQQAGIKAAITRKKNREDRLQQAKQECEEQRYKTPEKESQREMMYKLLVDVCDNQDNHNQILYLDSHTMDFTKEIFGENYDNNVVGGVPIFAHVPNHIEYDKFPKRFHRGKGNAPINLYNMSLNDYICSTSRQFRFVWGDYCGTFKKNRWDIELIFNRQMLCNSSIFAVTFCSRGDGTHKESDLKEKDLIRSVEDFVYDCAEASGYFVRPLKESGRYKQNMYTCIFKVWRQNTPNKDQATIDTIYELLHKQNEKIEKLTFVIDNIKQYERPITRTDYLRNIVDRTFSSKDDDDKDE